MGYVISLMVGVIIGCLVVTVLDKMSMFFRLVLLIAAGCLLLILDEWITIPLTVVSITITAITLALCQVAKDKEVK